MKAAQMGESNDPTLAGVFDVPSLRALLVQREMGSCRVVVSEVGAQEPFEMAVVVDDHVIEPLASDRANQTLGIGILPGRRGAMSTSSIARLRTRRRNSAP